MSGSGGCRGRQGFVFEPEDVEVGFVSGDDVVVAEFAPAAFRVICRPGFLAAMAVGRVVTSDEILQVFVFHRVLFEGEVDVGAEVVQPDLFGPGLFTGRLVIEKDDVGFDTLLVEDTGGQAEDGVQGGVLQQPLSDGFAGPAFKENVVGDDDGGFAGGFEHSVDVLHKVELLVGGGGPKILAVIGKVFALLFAGFVGGGDATLFAKGGLAKT